MIRAALLLLLLTPAAARAQFGGSFALRSVSGDETDAANSNRRGYEFRLQYDGAFTPSFGWRADIAAIQMQYQRDIPMLDRRQVSENGAEVALYARADARDGALSGLYGFAGPVGSFRVGCGASGGFVDCDATPGQLVGYAVGLGFASRLSLRRELLFEVKFADRLVGGAGSSVISLGLGIRGLKN
jgi:hypothetical protein